jgi:hypothetical protein
LLRRIEAIRCHPVIMFPESHAHSFASIVYSSAYTKFHYLGAYLCALLNNQPMGFYSPSTLINDAKRHGLKVRPIDVQRSDWNCTLETLDEDERQRHSDPFAVRMGLRYPTLPQHSLVCTQAGPRRMQMIYKVNGQAVSVCLSGREVPVRDLGRAIPLCR